MTDKNLTYANIHDQLSDKEIRNLLAEELNWWGKDGKISGNIGLIKHYEEQIAEFTRLLESAKRQYVFDKLMKERGWGIHEPPEDVIPFKDSTTFLQFVGNANDYKKVFGKNLPKD
jgi:hypothetical protein